jgi:hypothetical protein
MQFRVGSSLAIRIGQIAFPAASLALFAFLPAPVSAQSGYYSHIVFDIALGSGAYFYSHANAIAPSHFE